MEADFIAFPKVPRLFRDIIITEKLDGTNASIHIVRAETLVDLPAGAHLVGDLVIRAGSRNRWISPDSDNYGFAKWVKANAEELIKLGEGRHYGEWWGNGIQRNYGLAEKRFSLFNVSQWGVDALRPACCHVVPTLIMTTFGIDVRELLGSLTTNGSFAAPGFMKPEGVMIYHTAAKQYFKATLDGDGHKGAEAA